MPTTPITFSSLLFLLILFTAHHRPSSGEQLTSFTAADTPWLPTQNRTLVSPALTFAAGFRPHQPNLFIFSIWVANSTDRTVIWSLHRHRPVNGSAALTVSPTGSLSLPDPTGHNLFPASANATRLLLHDNGSLTFGGWTSTLSPTNTILAGHPVPTNGTTLRSPKFRLVNASTLVFNASDRYWSTGTIRNLTTDGTLVHDGTDTIITADHGETPLRRLTLDDDGNLRIYSLDSTSGEWRMVWQALQELCTILGTCGPNSICVPVGSNSTSCVCPPGYTLAGDGGCNRKTVVMATSNFVRLDYVSFTSGPETVTSPPLDFAACQSRCVANSSCIAFSYKFNGAQSCFHHLDHLRYPYWSPVTEISMFLPVATPNRDDGNNFTAMTTAIDTSCPPRIVLQLPPKESRTTAIHIAVICSLFAVELTAAALAFWAFLRRYSKYLDMARTFGVEFLPAGGPRRFSYAELRAATDDFAHELGRGGFGVVYKGVLPDRRAVAIKRLKRVAGGEAEFWAEVTIIARMHHLNLVRMWGFCAEKEQRMLVYEYVPNGSLDRYIFTSGDVAPMDWGMRYRIAVGVARAVAYLHEECLEWVLHCDIKPENILLGDDFCPKVSDFGLSKLTERRDWVSMSNIRGTRGYMAPEWITRRELITAKADVYSFGVVLLEMVTGVRSFDFRRSSLESEDWFLPNWAYKMVYVEKKMEEVVDRRMQEAFEGKEQMAVAERMVKTAMWCLQDRAEARPSMGRVAKMLEGTVEITEPGRPVIFVAAEESTSSFSTTD